MCPVETCEVAVVGGGPAGLSAALTLGRSRRSTVVFDAGAPRNAPAAAAHNVFTRDGTPPLELLRIAREQLQPYPTVTLRAARIDDAAKVDGGFVITDEHGARLQAERLVLATGVVDRLPDVPGLRDAWGRGAYHCPYCHGWEVRDEPFVLLAEGERAVHLAQVLRGWSAHIVVVPVWADALDADQRRALQALGLAVHDPVERLEVGDDGRVRDVVLVDGTSLGPAAVFTSAGVAQRSPLAEQLGAAVATEGMFAGLIEVDLRGATSVPGLFVAGDSRAGFPQVVSAAAAGATCGAMVNHELLLEGKLPLGLRNRI